MLNHITIMRTLAITLVLLFHFDNSILMSGYIGVDIFFVISGYLIASIALKRIQNKQDIWQFYIKRAMRIYPVLIFISFVIIFGLSLIEYLELETLQMIRDTFAFRSNFTAEKINLDYWGNNNNNYMLHLWSIAIEVQFYLIFPWLILNSKVKIKLPLITGGVIALTTVILVLFEFSYYHSIGRILAFSVGVLSCLMKDNFKSNNYIYFISIVALVALSFFNLDVISYPNHYNVIVVFISSLALLFGEINKKSIYKPFIFTGIISYSTYLWHYPLFLFFNHYGFSKNIINISGLFIVLFLLSVFSYYIVEKRFIPKNYGKKTILIIIIPLLVLMSIVYYKKNQTIDLPVINKFYEKFTLNPLLYFSDLARLEVSNRYKGCLDNKGQLLTNCSTTKINKQTKTALVLGNSFVHSGGLVFLDQVTAHYNIKSDFYYLFGDDITQEKLYNKIKKQEYDYLILYYPWWDVTKSELLRKYRELSNYTQIVFVKGTKYNRQVDKKQLFRFNNLFIREHSKTYECICQKPFTTDKDYAVVNSVLEELNATSINIYDVQQNDNGDYICSYNNIALYLDTSHINNYAGELFAKRFIEKDLGKAAFTK